VHEKLRIEKFKALKIKDVMEAPVTSEQSEGLDQLNPKFIRSPSEMVGVVSEGKLKGVVTRTNLSNGLMAGKRSVVELMQENPITIGEDGTVEDAIQLMTSRQFDKLPVIDAEGHFVGVVSKKSLLRQAAHDLSIEY